ncbi:hypothetical protein IL306_001570 [Fusarium sp. DS 682]|nr:hypothetical protein IL306_001570 [Fusarium sp. DS 682]
MTTDGNELQQLDPDTLEPIELFTYQASHPLLVNGGRSAAHPVVAKDSTVYNYVIDMDAQPPIYRVFSINPPTGETKIMANITDAPPAYIHSMFGTEKHIILIVWQADLVKPAYTILDSIGDWDEARHTLFYVMDRVSGRLVRKYEADHAFFAFHEINSFENDEGDIFIDLPRMDDASFIFAAKIENLRANLGSPNVSSGQDNTTPLVTYDAEVDFTIPYELGNIELPRIHPGYMGKTYRYAYGIHVKQKGYFADSIIKIDTNEKAVKIWSPETRHLPSEPIFVKRPGAEAEDDGVLLTVVMSQKEKKSSLVVLDAVTLTEIARARMPIVMGYGFHGVWGTG